MQNWLIFLLLFSNICFASNLNDGNTVIIVSHVDDEILIMEPLIENSIAIIFAGAAINQQKYKKLLDIYDTGPYGNKPIYLAFVKKTGIMKLLILVLEIYYYMIINQHMII